jgi:MFS transporter, DHA1 family, tetracycline resistance protein
VEIPKNFGGFNSPLAVVTVAMFLNAVGFTLVIPVLPFLIGAYVPASAVGVGVGVITAIYALCQFASAPVLGAISDRFGRRPVLLVSLLGSAVGYVVFGVGGALWVLFLGRVIDGLTGGNISTMYAYVADVTPPAERGRVYGLLGAASGFGFIVGPAIGGGAGAISLTAPLFVAAAVTLGAAGWAYVALPESLAVSGRGDEFAWGHLNPFAPFALVMRSPALRVAFAASFCFFFAGAMLQSNLSVFLKDVLAFGPGGVGAMLVLAGVMDIVSQGWLAGWLLPRLGERRLARIGLAVNALGFFLIALVSLAPAVGFIVVAAIVEVLGDGLFQPAIGGIVANAAPAGAQGRVQGANQGQQSIARIVGPLLAAALYVIDVGAPYLVGAVVLLAAVAVLGGRRAKLTASRA